MNCAGRPTPSWARWLMTPIGWPMQIAAAGVIVYGFYEYTKAGNFGGQIGTAFLWLVLLVIWGGRLIVRTSLAAFYQRPQEERQRGRWNAAVVPAILLLWIAMPSDWPRAIAFELSRPALERFVHKAKADPTAIAGWHWVGCYWICLDGVANDGVWVYTNPGYDAARCGYFYAISGKPQDENGNAVSVTYHSIGGPWYIYSDHRWPQRPLGTPPTTHPCGP